MLTRYTYPDPGTLIPSSTGTRTHTHTHMHEHRPTSHVDAMVAPQRAAGHDDEEPIGCFRGQTFRL